MTYSDLNTTEGWEEFQASSMCLSSYFSLGILSCKELIPLVYSSL